MRSAESDRTLVSGTVPSHFRVPRYFRCSAVRLGIIQWHSICRSTQSARSLQLVPRAWLLQGKIIPTVTQTMVRVSVPLLP